MTEKLDSILKDISPKTKIAFLVGAGISVNAGIPDFRSPNSGIYAKIKELGFNDPT